MRLPRPLIPAQMIARPSRFALWADVNGQQCYVHVPNSGRMRELLYPGAPVCLRETPGDGRRTTHRLVLARQGRTWVSVDSRLAPALLLEYLRLHPEVLGAVSHARREVAYGASRFDLELHTSRGIWVVETKSVTLCRNDRGLFPDAPTERGARHLCELAQIARAGGQAAVVFVVQRSDARSVAPNEATDPRFSTALREASAAGVLPLALVCRVTAKAVTPHAFVPVELRP
ncbi:MAG: DNA/RNA nuclease SfsA [Armatimonadetes bacterium]|nr:DNA/RNA nuclease SfsA [Armatimonadota bacterium]